MAHIPVTSLRSFLQTAKRALETLKPPFEDLTLVIGNESADLDSISSAVIFSYLRSSVRTSKPGLYIPIVNIPRADIRIRPELYAVARHANFEPENLITYEDVPSFTKNQGSSSACHKINFFLVDHNAFKSPLSTVLDPKIVGCFDHHVDEGHIPMDVEGLPRRIATCGSCTSLVVDSYCDAWDALSLSSQSSAAANSQDDAGVRRTWDSQAALMALASVLIDTHNLKDESKTTEKDCQIVEYLEVKIRLKQSTFDRKEFYRDIKDAKSNVDALTVEECLRKDYKEWSSWPWGEEKLLGLSSVVKPISWLAEKAQAEAENLSAGAAMSKLKAAFQSFASARKLDIYGIMTTASSTSDGQRQRQILLYSPAEANAQFLERFAVAAQHKLELEEWGREALEEVGTGLGEWQLKIWQQRNLGYTRKQVAPLLREVIGGKSALE